MIDAKMHINTMRSFRSYSSMNVASYFLKNWKLLMIGGWGGETNREIDFGFGSVVRARGLVVRWE